MEHGARDIKKVTSVGLTTRARTILRALATLEGTSASALVESMILSAGKDRGLDGTLNIPLDALSAS